ncbi:ATP-binding protein [Cellulosimicrobium sp. 22601]|uniref:sensor histidine kinase n=1 Tax=unclassified Cellulosimicrobium TaxID=2624466 RepID=UPI003F82D9E9
MKARLTLRARLTLVYGGAFALAGAVLVTVMYVLVAAAIDRQPLDTVGIAAYEVTYGTTAPLATAAPLSGAPARTTTGTAAPAEAILDSPIDSWAAVQATDAETLQDVRDLVVAQNREARDATLGSVLLWSVVALAVIGVLAVAFGWVMATRVLAPLHRVTATARRVAENNLHERIALDGPEDEMKDLADTFDEMLDRLDRSFDGQRRFVANASHELRTPLTINRTVLEVALQDPDAPAPTRHLGNTLLAVNARHERLIEGLLTLAAADQTPGERSPVDLAEVVDQVRRASAATARDAGVELRVVPDGGAGTVPDDGGATTSGDPVLLERLVQNLVDNAVRHNDPGGFVEVSARRVDGAVEVRVENSGPVVPSSAVESLFEPFRRLGRDGAAADRSAGFVRGGVGLGLSIVRSVASAHDGTVQAVPRDGGGLVVRARFAAA